MHTIEAHDCAIASLSFESKNGNLISVDCDRNSMPWDVESEELVGNVNIDDFQQSSE